MSKKENDYFQMFIDAISISSDAIENVMDFLNHFDLSKIRTQLDILHEIERKGDDIKHELTEKLTGEFLPPIEREDIMDLSQNLDTVTDKVEDILIKIYMFNITAMTDEALQFVSLISKSVNILKEIMIEFKNFKKSDRIKELVVEINNFEEKADELYTTAIHSMFTGNEDTKYVFAWTEVLHIMENCCDTCEHTSNLIETIIMKNS